MVSPAAISAATSAAPTSETVTAYVSKPPRGARRQRNVTPPARRSMRRSADLATAAGAGRPVIVDGRRGAAGRVVGAMLEAVLAGVGDRRAAGGGEGGDNRRDQERAGSVDAQGHGRRSPGRDPAEGGWRSRGRVGGTCPLTRPLRSKLESDVRPQRNGCIKGDEAHPYSPGLRDPGLS